MRIRAILLCSLAGCAPAYANNCKDGGSNQSEMNICAAEGFRKADAALNAAYKTIVACLKGDEESERMLVESQRAWVRFRDAECKFAGRSFEGGTAQPMIISGCLGRLTEQRTAGLKDYATGDLDCSASK